MHELRQTQGKGTVGTKADSGPEKRAGTKANRQIMAEAVA